LYLISLAALKKQVHWVVAYIIVTFDSIKISKQINRELTEPQALI